jgi:hypothetical protein
VTQTRGAGGHRYRYSVQECCAMRGSSWNAGVHANSRVRGFSENLEANPSESIGAGINKLTYIAQPDPS